MGAPGGGHAALPPLQPDPGQPLEVEVVQPDGGRALVVGVLDSVPDTTHGRAMKIKLCDARGRVLQAE
jgi:hypothetical protein